LKKLPDLKNLHIIKKSNLIMKKAIAKYGITMRDSQLFKMQEHSTCHTARGHTTPTKPSRIRDHVVSNSVTQVSSEFRGKPIRGEYQGKSQPLFQKGLKAMQQVCAFGPAHAEKARMLYKLKGTRYQQRQENCLVLPHRSNIYCGSQILSQNELAQNCTNKGQLPKAPVQHGQRVQFGTSWNKEVPIADLLKHNKPILNILTISSRPGKYRRKLRSFSDVEHSECARDQFVEKQPSDYQSREAEKDLPILRILEKISNSNVSSSV